MLVLQLIRILPPFTEPDTFFRVQKKTSLYLNIRQHPTPVPRISFLGAFAYLRKVPITFVISVRFPSVKMYQRRPHWTNFCEILYWDIKMK